MTLLEVKLTEAKTKEDLRNLVNSIKKQENGFKNELANHLENAFWYCDLINNLEAQKKWMLKVTAFYSDTEKELN